MSAYPSLARRPIERTVLDPVQPVAGTPAAAAVPQPVSASLSDALAALARDADGGERAFRAEVAAARSVIAAGSGAATGSEAWAAAQVALSRLEAVRAPTIVALAELDRLAVDQADAGNGAAVERIADEQRRITALVAGQHRVLNELMPN
jgi:hypothetical protein